MEQATLSPEFLEVCEKIINRKMTCNLSRTYCDYPTLEGPAFELGARFLNYVDELVIIIQNQENYDENPASKTAVSDILYNAYHLFHEPLNVIDLCQSMLFGQYMQVNNLNVFEVMKLLGISMHANITKNAISNTKSKKRKNSETSIEEIPLNNDLLDNDNFDMLDNSDASSVTSNDAISEDLRSDNISDVIVNNSVNNNMYSTDDIANFSNDIIDSSVNNVHPTVDISVLPPPHPSNVSTENIANSNLNCKQSATSNANENINHNASTSKNVSNVKSTKNNAKSKVNANVNKQNGASQNGASQNGETTQTPARKIQPFLCEIKGPWTNIAKTVTELNKNKPLIKMDGAYLKILCKDDNDFRVTQNYLDEQAIHYTTLSPLEKRPRKVCIRGIPINTDPSVIIEALQEKGFICNRVAMLKNRRTGNLMPICLANVLPRDQFEQIFEIKELCYISVTVERFRGAGIVKQCRRCQAYGHASEICGFDPKCVKCAGGHLTQDCPHKTKLEQPKCINCHGMHPASYRGCPKNPQNAQKNNKKSTNYQSKPKTNNNQKITPDIAQLLSNHNYVKNKQTNSVQDKYVYRPNAFAEALEKKKTNSTTTPSSTGLPALGITKASDKQNKSTVPPTPKSPETEHNISQDISEVFQTFKEIKDILNLNKLLSFLKNVADLTKRCKTPYEKMLIIISQLDCLFSEIQLPNNE